MKLPEKVTVSVPTTVKAPQEVTPEVADYMERAWKEVQGKENGDKGHIAFELEDANEVTDFMAQAREWGKNHKPELAVRVYAPRNEGRKFAENVAAFTIKAPSGKQIGFPKGGTRTPKGDKGGAS